MYRNPLLHVDEDDDYEYAEDDDRVMAVARTPHRKGERPSLKVATARALEAEEESRRLEEQVQGLQAQLRGDCVVQAEELQEPGYTGDAADQVVILDPLAPQGAVPRTHQVHQDHHIIPLAEPN